MENQMENQGEAGYIGRENYGLSFLPQIYFKIMFEAGFQDGWSFTRKPKGQIQNRKP